MNGLNDEMPAEEFFSKAEEKGMVIGLLFSAQWCGPSRSMRLLCHSHFQLRLQVVQSGSQEDV